VRAVQYTLVTIVNSTVHSCDYRNDGEQYTLVTSRAYDLDPVMRQDYDDSKTTTRKGSASDWCPGADPDPTHCRDWFTVSGLQVSPAQTVF
jgi:hypothetical protein